MLSPQAYGKHLEYVKADLGPPPEGLNLLGSMLWILAFCLWRPTKDDDRPPLFLFWKEADIKEVLKKRTKPKVPKGTRLVGVMTDGDDSKFVYLFWNGEQFTVSFGEDTLGRPYCYCDLLYVMVWFWVRGHTLTRTQTNRVPSGQ
jgi:hypothetical protein